MHDYSQDIYNDYKQQGFKGTRDDFDRIVKKPDIQDQIFLDYKEQGFKGTKEQFLSLIPGSINEPGSINKPEEQKGGGASDFFAKYSALPNIYSLLERKESTNEEQKAAYQAFKNRPQKTEPPKSFEETYNSLKNLIPLSESLLTVSPEQKDSVADSFLKGLGITKENTDEGLSPKFGKINPRDKDNTVLELSKSKDQRIREVEDKYNKLINAKAANQVISPYPGISVQTSSEIPDYEKQKKEEIKKINSDYDTVVKNLISPSTNQNSKLTQDEKTFGALKFDKDNPNKGSSEINATTQQLVEFNKFTKSNSDDVWKQLSDYAITVQYAGDIKKRDMQLMRNNLAFSKNLGTAYKEDFFKLEEQQNGYLGLRLTQDDIDSKIERTKKLINNYKEAILNSDWTNNLGVKSNHLKQLQSLEENLSVLNETKSILSDIENKKLLPFKKYLGDQKLTDDLGDKYPLADLIKLGGKYFFGLLSKPSELFADYLTNKSDFGKKEIDFNGRKYQIKEILASEKDVPQLSDIQARVKDIETGEMTPVSSAKAIKLFDENGKFLGSDFKISARPLFYNTLKVSIDSGLLMAAGGVLAGAIGKLGTLGLETTGLSSILEGTEGATGALKPFAARARDLVGSNETLKNILIGTADVGRFATNATSMIVPSVFLYGEDIYKDYLRQGFSPDQSMNLALLSSAIEGSTEAIFNNEIRIFNSLMGLESSIAKEVSEKTFMNAIEDMVLKATGKELSENGSRFALNLFKFGKSKTLKNLGIGIKEFIKINLEETTEEEIGLLAKTFLENPLAKSYKAGYQPSEEFDTKNIVDTAIQTMATMIPTSIVGGGAAVKNHYAVALQSKLSVATNPKYYSNLVLEMMHDGRLSKEEGERRLSLINDFSQIYKNAKIEKLVENVTKEKNYNKDEIEQYAFQQFEKQVKKYELEKNLEDELDLDKRAKILESISNIDESIKKLTENGIYENEEEEINSKKKYLSYFFSPEVLSKINNKDSLNQNLKQVNRNNQANLKEVLNEDYATAIKNIQSRISELEKEEEPDTEESKTSKGFENATSIEIKDKKGDVKILPFNTPIHILTTEEFTTEGKLLNKRPILTIYSQNDDGTLNISLEGEYQEGVSPEALSNYSFVTKKKIDELRDKKHPQAFVFDNDNNVFSYRFGKETPKRKQLVNGRIKYNNSTNQIEFFYKDNDGKIVSFSLGKSDIQDYRDNKENSKLKFVKSLEKNSNDDEENKKSLKSAKNINLDEIASQAKRRFDFIKNYIESKIKSLNEQKKLIKDAEKQLVDLQDEVEYYSLVLKEIPEKTKTGGKRIDFTKTFKKIQSLKETQTNLENTIQKLNEEKEELEKEIEYLSSYKGKEFDVETPISEQLLDDWVNLNEQKDLIDKNISTIENLIDGIKNTINNFLKNIDSLLTIAKKLYPGIPLDITKFTDFVNKNPNIIKLQPDFAKDLTQFQEIINNNLDAIEKEDFKVENLQKTLKANQDLAKKVTDEIKYQEELIKAAEKASTLRESSKISPIQIISKQNKSQTSSETDEKQSPVSDEEAAKIDLLDLFSATTSGAERTPNGFSQGLDKPQVLILQNFLNTVKNIFDYKLLVVTKNNAKFFGLEDILFTSDEITNKTDNESDNDIKFVIVDKNNKPVDQNGNPTQDVSKIVYASLRTDKLSWKHGEKNYKTNLKGKAEEETAKLLQENHKKFRQSLLDITKQNPKSSVTLAITSISRGFPTQETNKKNPVSVLVSVPNINNSQVIFIPTESNSTVNYFEKAIKMPIGRIVFSFNQFFGFLNPRKFDDSDVNKYVKIFKHLYDLNKEGKNIDTIINYLEKTLYFRNPEIISKVTNKAQESNIGNSQIWFSDKNGLLYLNLGTKYSFPFNMESNNTQAYITLEDFLKDVYHNVDAKDLVGKPFTEILDVENGELKTQEWGSYQEYLISDKNKDGSDRTSIPLTVNINKSVENTPNICGRYLTFDYPKNENVTKTSNTPEVKTEQTTEQLIGGYKDLQKIENKEGKTFKYTTKNSEGQEKFVIFKIEKDNVIPIEWNYENLNGEKFSYDFVSKVLQNSLQSGQRSFYEIKSQEKPVNTEVKPETQVLKEVSSLKPESQQVDAALDYLNNLTIEDTNTDIDHNQDLISYFRLALEKQYVRENLKEVEKWWSERFPQIPFEIINGLIEEKAWGRLKDACVTISDIAEKGTTYHEAFEVVYRYFLTPSQVKAIHRDFRNRQGEFIDRETGKSVKYSEATNHQIKEQLAEEYRDYEMSEGKKIWKGETIKNGLFRKIWSFIHDFLFKNSPQSIENIFKSISEAKYKDRVPSNFLNNTSDFRLKELKKENPLFVHDLMESMTNILFTRLIDTGRNIPEVLSSNYNIDVEQEIIRKNINYFYGGEALAKLAWDKTKDDFIKLFKNQQFGLAFFSKLKEIAPSLYENLNRFSIQNNLSAESKLSKLYDAFEDYRTISDNWDDIRKEHKLFLSLYNIEFKTQESEQDDIINSDEDKNQNDYIRDALKQSFKDNSSAEIKLLLATLKKENFVKPKNTLNISISDENNNIPREGVLNSMLMTSLVPYKKTVINLLYKLVDATDVNEMMDIIEKNSSKDTIFAQLKTKLKIGSPNLNESDILLRSKFFSAMNNMQVDYVKLLLNADGSSTLFNINDVDAMNDVKSNWLFGYIDSPIILKSGDKFTIKASEVPSNIKNYQEAKAFLNKIGFKYSLSDTDLTLNEKQKVLSATQQIRTFILKYTPDRIIADNNINQNFRNLLTPIAEIYINNTNNYAEPQHLNIEREPVQNIILNNFPGYLSKVFASVNSLEDLYKKIKQLNPKNEGNSILSNSQVLSPDSNFFTDGKKNKDISLLIVEGSEKRGEGEGIPSSKLTLTDRTLQEFVMNLNGIYYVLTPADTKTEWAIKFGNFISESQAKDDTFVTNIFKNYLEAEIKAVQDFQKGYTSDIANLNKIQNGKKLGEQLRFFKEILPFELDITPKTDAREIINQNEEKINKAILDFINKNIQESIDFINKNNLKKKHSENQQENKEGFTKLVTKDGYDVQFLPEKYQNLTEEEIQDLIRFNNINYMFNIIEQFKLMWVDPYHWKDITKRTKSFVSPRVQTIHSDKAFNDFYNKNNNTLSFVDEKGNVQNVVLQPGDFGYSFYDDSIKTMTFKDITVKSVNFDELDRAFKEELSNDLFDKSYSELNKAQKEEIDSKILSNKYEEINEADAQGNVFPNGYKEIRLRSNTWTEADEAQKKWDDALCRWEVSNGRDYITKNKINIQENLYPSGKRGELLKKYDNYILSLGNPYLEISKHNAKEENANNQRKLPSNYVLKPIYSGFKNEDRALQNIDKLSLAPLTWRSVKETNSQKFYLEHFKKGTTYIKFESANKVGQLTDIPSIYDKDGNPNLNINHEQLDFKYFGIQVETKTQKDKTTLGTQLTKLATLNLMTSGVPIDFIKSNKGLSKEELLDAWENLTNEEKAKISPIYKLILNNGKILSTLKTKAKKQIYKEFGIVETEKGYKFDNYEKLHSLIQRELNNRQVPDNLKDAIQLDETGRFVLPFDMIIGGDKVDAIFTSIIDKRILRPKLFGGQMPQIASTLFENSSRESSKKIYTSNFLKFYENEDGKRYCEIMLPFYYKEFISKGTELSIKDIPEELQYGIGFRIPTQEINSVEHFKIKGFLPVEYGNSVIVPSEITAKAGSDFDIDKLNIYLYNYTVKNGKPKKIEYSTGTSIEDVKKRYEESLKINDFYKFLNSLEGYEYFKSAKDVASTNLISDIFNEDINDDRLDFTKSYEENLELAKSYGNITFEEFSKLSIEEQNSKEALENYYIDNLREILTLPENYAKLTRPNSADNLKNQANEIKKLYGKEEQKKSFLNRLDNAETRHSFLVGKEGVGIAASQQTQHAICQIINFVLPSFYKFSFPTNQLVKEGPDYNYDFSAKTTRDGETISSIISSFVDAFVDIAKEPYIFDINGNLQTASAYIVGIRMGIPLNLMTRWLNQPIVIAYVKAKQQNKVLIGETDSFVFQTTLSKFNAKESMRNKNFIASELESYIKEYAKPDFDIETSSQEFRDAQYHILTEFRNLESISNKMFNFGQAINLDTSRTVSFESVRIKIAKIYQALQDEELRENVLKAYDITFIKSILDSKLDILAAIKPFYLTESDNARAILNPILNSIYNTKFVSSNNIEEAAKNLKKHFLSYLLQTLPISINNEIAAPINMSIPDIISSESNIASGVRNVQNAIKDGKIENNYFVQHLFGLIAQYTGKKSKVNNVKLLSKPSEKIENDLLISDFYNLKNNPLTEKLYYDLIKGFIIQSGLLYQPNSVTEFIPNETFKSISEQIINQFVNEDIYKTLQGFNYSYIANNWYNVTKTTGKSNSGKSRLVKRANGKKDFIEFFAGSPTKPDFRPSKQTKYPYLLYWKKYGEEFIPTLYKRYEEINPSTGLMDARLILTSSARNQQYCVVFYPVAIYGEKNSIFEHHSPKLGYKPSIVNNNNGTYTPDEEHKIKEIYDNEERNMFTNLYLNHNILGIEPNSPDFIEKVKEYFNFVNMTNVEISPSVTNELKNIKIQMQPDNILKILNDTKTTTTKSADQSELPKKSEEISVSTLNKPEIKVISEDYGVVKVETEPSAEKTEQFVSLLRPQIESQTFKENKGKAANDMFHFGLRWGRQSGLIKPVKIDSAAGSSEYYGYDTLDQKGRALPPLSDLQPIIEEIQKTLGIDMKDYDSVIGNIYLEGQYIYPHKDTTESKSARNYPVIVYTIGNNSALGIVDNNKGKMTFANQYDEKFLPANEKLSGYTNEVLTKNGTIYTFGLEGKGRFELTHSTPTLSQKPISFPEITLPNGKKITKYTITLTFRRAQNLTENVPKSPVKLAPRYDIEPLKNQELSNEKPSSLQKIVNENSPNGKPAIERTNKNCK
jgi:hypothetical protein